jgi:hypothetical protein
MVAPLRPDERELYAWHSDDSWDLVAHERIEALTQQRLQRIASRDGGWTVLYRDPADGRFWELSFPRSELHGGGPAKLSFITRDEAMRLYPDVCEQATSTI